MRSSPDVLVATPARKNTTTALLQQAREIYEALTYPYKSRALHLNDISRPAGAGKYYPNAVARNELVDRYLRAWHSHVLWLDADLVDVPVDIVERLLDVGDDCVVAPLVFVEKLDPNRPVSMGNGGWFYDTGGFVRCGSSVHMWQSDLGPEPIVEMDSVGTCYLVPAEVYARGARYSVVGDSVEHVPFMEGVREMGYSVWARQDTKVLHAYLPRYGEAWHS